MNFFDRLFIVYHRGKVTMPSHFDWSKERKKKTRIRSANQFLASYTYISPWVICHGGRSALNRFKKPPNKKLLIYSSHSIKNCLDFSIIRIISFPLIDRRKSINQLFYQFHCHWKRIQYYCQLYYSCRWHHLEHEP